MTIANLKKKGSLETMYGETLDIISDLMGAAIRSMPGSRECNGLFSLWAYSNGKEPVEQMEFETVSYYNKRIRALSEFDEPVGTYDDVSCRLVLNKAIAAAHEATCEFFPLRSAMRIMLPADKRQNGYPLTTGYYVYCPNEDVSGPIVMVLRTSMGVFYAGFIANVFDYTSMQNSTNFSVYLMSTLVNINGALSGEDDWLLNLGMAELLDIPAVRPGAFKPNRDSSLICFDRDYCFFKTLKDVDKQMSIEFLAEVERRRLRILERTNGMKIKLFAN